VSCHRHQQAMAKKTKDSDDVLSLLDSLGEAVPPPQTTSVSVEDPALPENEREVLSFLDDLAKQPPRAQTPRPAAAAEGGAASRDVPRKVPTSPRKSADETPSTPVPANQAPTQNVKAQSESGGGWFGNLWSMGTAAMTMAEQKVKELQQTEEAKAWEERVRGNVSVLGKFGTTLLFISF